jgi:hypothetical protein
MRNSIDVSVFREVRFAFLIDALLQLFIMTDSGASKKAQTKKIPMQTTSPPPSPIRDTTAAKDAAEVVK